MFLKFEHRRHAVLPRPEFLRRLLKSGGVGFALVTVSLIAGMLGFHFTEGLAWIDSFTNASMLLSGMGPLSSPTTTAGKLFAGCYALYSGLAVLVIAGIMFAPLVHRFLHLFHADETDEAKETRQRE